MRTGRKFDFVVAAAIGASISLVFSVSDLSAWLRGAYNTSLLDFALWLGCAALWLVAVLVLFISIIARALGAPGAPGLSLRLPALAICLVPCLWFSCIPRNPHSAFVNGFARWARQVALPKLHGWHPSEISDHPLMPPADWWQIADDAPMGIPLDAVTWPDSVRALSPTEVWRVKEGTLLAWMGMGFCCPTRFLYLGVANSRPPKAIDHDFITWIEVEPGTFVGGQYPH